MSAARLALYTFGIFREPAEHPANAGFHARNDAALLQAEQSAGFIARSGYDGDPGPESWGLQVWPHFYVEKGDGWSPATLSLWTEPEAIAAFTYDGLHGEAVRLGRDWFVKGDWPPFAMWWVAPDHTPDWAEAVERHEYLHEHGPQPRVFNFARLYSGDGRRLKLDRQRIDALRDQNRTGDRK